MVVEAQGFYYRISEKKKHVLKICYHLWFFADVILPYVSKPCVCQTPNATVTTKKPWQQKTPHPRLSNPPPRRGDHPAEVITVILLHWSIWFIHIFLQEAGGIDRSVSWLFWLTLIWLDWIGFDLIGFDLIGLDWIWLFDGWIGLDWINWWMDWIGFDLIHWWIGLDWIGLDLINCLLGVAFNLAEIWGYDYDV